MRRLDHRGECLDQRVDGIGAHRVAGVEEDVHDDHRLAPRRADEPDLHVARAGPAPTETGCGFLGRRQQARACRAEPLDGGARIGDVDELDLADHRSRVRLGDEPARGAGDECGVGGGRDHGRLLDHHRDHVVASVHLEIERHAEWQRERADGVLDHDVRDVERQRVGRSECLDLRRRQLDRLREPPSPLGDRQLVERWNA